VVWQYSVPFITSLNETEPSISPMQAMHPGDLFLRLMKNTINDAQVPEKCLTIYVRFEIEYLKQNNSSISFITLCK